MPKPKPRNRLPRGPPWRPSRREFLGAAGLALLGVACSGSNDVQTSSTAPASGAGLVRAAPRRFARRPVEGREQLSRDLARTRPPGPGTFRFAFALSDRSTPSLVTGGGPQVFARPTRRRRPGPVRRHLVPVDRLRADARHLPEESAAAGTYEADLTIPPEGNWVIGGGRVRRLRSAAFGTAAIAVTTAPRAARDRLEGDLDDDAGRHLRRRDRRRSAPARPSVTSTPSRWTRRWRTASRPRCRSPRRCCARASCAARSSTS